MLMTMGGAPLWYCTIQGPEFHKFFVGAPSIFNEVHQPGPDRLPAETCIYVWFFSFPSSRQQVQNSRLAEAQSGHLLEALLGVVAPVACDKPVKDRVLAARLRLVT